MLFVKEIINKLLEEYITTESFNYIFYKYSTTKDGFKELHINMKTHILDLKKSL